MIGVKFILHCCEGTVAVSFPLACACYIYYVMRAYGRLRGEYLSFSFEMYNPIRPDI